MKAMQKRGVVMLLETWALESKFNGLLGQCPDKEIIRSNQSGFAMYSIIFINYMYYLVIINIST